MQFIKQCKGKDLAKVPKYKLEDIYYSSIKYDGHYVQIHKVGKEVKFFTSGGKEFYHELAAESLLLNNFDFIIETEFIANTDGKLGNRGKAAKLTTYRTNFNKGIANVGLDTSYDCFRVFDIIIENSTFSIRKIILDKITNTSIIQIVQYQELTLDEAIKSARVMIKEGYEGLFIKSLSHIYLEGKRVNTAIKLKLRPTADLICIGVNNGEGKYNGMIGSLILQDEDCRVVSVGSGLDYCMRSKDSSYYIGEIIEIEYEQILDTYIQPIFKCIRYDKC